jgi:hypothetical protein
VRLGDGNQASVGDVIITRSNDRRLRLSATDWVKNGDRWTITHVDRSGGLTVRHSRTCSPSPPKPASIHSATYSKPPADAASLPQATWPPSSTGASLPSRLPTQGRCLGSGAFQKGLQAHPVWGPYLAKRSQLVADLADQVQDHACDGDAEPAWAAPETHLSTALIGEIAVWRAANGINPQDPRPTASGTQFETLPALWKQRLDRDIARATDPPADARADNRQAAHAALSSYDDRQRPYQKPERRPTGPSAPRR